MMRKLNILVLFSMLIGILTSCELNINDDPNYPATASNDLLLSSGIAFSAASIGGDYQLIGGIWSQHYTQNTTSNQYKTIDSYGLSSSDYNRPWNNLWAGALYDFKIVRKQSKVSGQNNFYGVSTLLTAFDLSLLVDLYGDIPLDQALSAEDGILNPAYESGDTANSVNPKLLTLIDEAIVALNAAKTSVIPDPTFAPADIIYGGDLDSWIAFGNSLKLKILMRDFENQQAAIATLLANGNLISSDAKMAIFENKQNSSNPLFENDRRMLNTGVNLKASMTAVKFLTDNGDPRIANYYEVQEDGLYVGIEQGNYEQTPTLPASATSLAKLSPTDPVYFMSVIESEFTQAEAYARLNDATNSKIHYDAGVTASFLRTFNESAGTIGSSSWSADVADLDATPFISAGGKYEFLISDSKSIQIEKIMTQKWIAATRAQAWDSFLDQNRTGYPKLLPINSVDAYDDVAYKSGMFVISENSVLSTGLLPRRMLYPKSSTDYNSNAPEFKYIEEKMWWHAANPL